MTRKEQLESVEMDVKGIKNYLSHNKSVDITKFA